MIGDSILGPIFGGISSARWGANNQLHLPRTGLLLYLARPNSDGYLTDETSEIPEDEVNWGFYTGEDATIIVAIENALGAGNVLEGVALATEIAAATGVNDSNVLFKLGDATGQTGKLAIYAIDTPADVLAKAKKVLKIL